MTNPSIYQSIDDLVFEMARDPNFNLEKSYVKLKSTNYSEAVQDAMTDNDKAQMAKDNEEFIFQMSRYQRRLLGTIDPEAKYGLMAQVAGALKQQLF